MSPHVFVVEDDMSQDDSSEKEEEGIEYENIRPSYCHEALAELMKRGHLKHIISQNCDGLHELSGQKSFQSTHPQY